MTKYLIPLVITQHHKYLTAASHLHASHFLFASCFALPEGPTFSFLLPEYIRLKPEPALEGVMEVAHGSFKIMHSIQCLIRWKSGTINTY